MTQLTDAELERLALLAEEASEVIQLVSKIIRFGKESYHPNDQTRTTNKELLAMECGHLMLAIKLAVQEGDIDVLELESHAIRKMDSINNYLKYNEILPDE